MRVRLARAVMAIVFAAGAVTSAVAGTVSASASGIPTPGETWLPPTPTYWPLVVGEQSGSSQVITHGVDLHSETYQTVGGAQRAQVMNVDLTDPNVRFGMVEAGNKLIDPADETISSMANRTSAVAGVNADFFAINATGQPMGMVVQNGVLEASPVASWPYDLEVLANGQMEMATETFTGTADDTTTGSTQPLVAVNRIDQAGLTAVTPFLGAVSIGASTIVAATAGSDGTLTIAAAAKTSQTSLPQVPAGQEDLIARRGTAASTWLQGVHVGDTLKLSESLAPYGIGQIQTAVSGGAYLAQNGLMAVPVQGGGENNVAYPIVGVGVSQDGTHAIIAVFDGRASENQAVGLTRPQFAQWMLAHGAYNAIEFDSGGSAEMVGRLPGQQQVSVLNTPSDGAERPVANGLFLYTNETSPGPAVSAAVSNGAAMAILPGATEPLPAYATDAAGNPASGQVQVTVQPPKLATVSGSGADLTITAGSQAGRGMLTVTAGGATSQEPLTVAGSLTSLSMSPTQPDLNNNDTQQFSLSGTAAGAPAGGFQTGPLTISPPDATWSVSPSSLGTVSSSGLFTAAASGNGLATVSATADGTTATATVAVGSSATVVDPVTDASNWGLNTTNGATASLAESTTQLAQPGDSGSMDVSYTIPQASGVSQVVFYPNYNVNIGPLANGEAPDAIGVWIKGIGGSGGTPLGKGILTFAEQWIEINGQAETFYPTAVTYNGWQLITAAIPAGTEFPLSVNFLDFLVINPAQTTSGDLYVADLEGLYSPRQPVTPTYTAIPDNPSWLQYTSSPAQFGPGGVTIADFDDSHLQSGDHNSTGSVVTNAINQDIQALPPNAAPNMLQVNGDLTDTGSIADTDDGYQVLQTFGLPFHDAVGNHEIGQGADPEDQNWSSLYGPTHYGYTDGDAEFIVTDSANGGLLASDPYQVPMEEQYQWLVSQLTASTSKVIFLVTHMPAYDPHAVMNSQFADRYEAQMYEQLAASYKATHPQAHMILLYGHARGFAEQLLDPLGNPDPTGLPNFTVADAGVPAYATVDQGGFYNYALFHIMPSGDVQFAVQPVLSSIAVTAPQPSVTVGTTEQLTATGTTPTGDDLPALQVPIADPASHLWSSSDTTVATVDPSTGVVTAVADGTATISVLSGGVTGSVAITVSS